MPKTILNIAAGKFDPIGVLTEKDPYFLINLDTMYYQYEDPALIEKKRTSWTETVNKKFHCNVDAFQFMERTRIMFDKICIYRFLEHVSFTQVQYFIYLLSTITNSEAEIDIIVPDYYKLAEMILKEKISDPYFEPKNILLTTELLNEPSCPHASIWTVERAKHFFELEGRFEVSGIKVDYPFDGRDIYLRFKAVRV